MLITAIFFIRRGPFDTAAPACSNGAVPGGPQQENRTVRKITTTRVIRDIWEIEKLDNHRRSFLIREHHLTDDGEFESWSGYVQDGESVSRELFTKLYNDKMEDLISTAVESRCSTPDTEMLRKIFARKNA